MPKKGRPLSPQEQCRDLGHQWNPWVLDPNMYGRGNPGHWRTCARCGQADSKRG